MAKPEHISGPLSRFNWRHQYDQARDEAEGLAAATVNNDPSLTQQHFSTDADINVLARRFGLDKEPIPHVATDPSWYGDVSDVPDLRTVLEITRDAQNRFMELPPRLRARFRNSPAEMWDFVNDPQNADEAVRLGLLVKAPEPEQKGAEEAPKPPTP